MKRILIFMVLSISLSFADDAPTNAVDTKDYVDPKLPAFDKRTWQNLLKYYKQARDIAKATLNEMDNVRDFCWSSYRYLYAVERAANRAQLIWDNITKFKAENPFDAVIYLEENIFQKSDLLFYYDMPQIKVQWAKLAASRDAIRNHTADRIAALNDMLPDGAKFETDYLRLMEMNSPDAKTLKDTLDKDVNFHMSVLSQASQQIASTDMYNQFSENQSAILESTIKNGTNDSISDPSYQAEYSKIGERNSLVLSLQENAQLSDGIKTGAFFLLYNAKRYADVLSAKQAAFFALQAFSDKLNEQGAGK